ncbi:GNAT family protein [Longispora sp. K20-0274]|uniref:GNAT family N-acetyltransferase n=1 Tax=Longispora sp. K20-0274 TaxID=3088255 RepID=UPI00399C4654
MVKPDLPIETARLRLRPYAAADVPDLYALESHPEVHRYLYSEPRDLTQVAERASERTDWVAFRAEGDQLALIVELKETREVIGNVNLHWVSETHRQGEIGYTLHPDHHGRGYASEAAAPLLRVGFEDLGLHRVIGRLDGRNTASARVLEKLGMRREAHLVQNEFVKGEWTDEVVYALLASEWTGASS